jgi:hypothetical protein
MRSTRSTDSARRSSGGCGHVEAGRHQRPPSATTRLWSAMASCPAASPLTMHRRGWRRPGPRSCRSAVHTGRPSADRRARPCPRPRPRRASAPPSIRASACLSRGRLWSRSQVRKQSHNRRARRQRSMNRTIRRAFVFLAVAHAFPVVSGHGGEARGQGYGRTEAPRDGHRPPVDGLCQRYHTTHRDLFRPRRRPDHAAALLDRPHRGDQRRLPGFRRPAPEWRPVVPAERQNGIT